MKYVIEVPEYISDEGLRFDWEPDFKISTRIEGQDTIVITANSQGLISLARHMLVLAQDTVPVGRHVHLDSSNSLEASSRELIIERE